MSRRSTPVPDPATPFLGAGMLGALALGALASAAPAASQEASPGAAPMAEQRAALAALGLAEDGVDPPFGVDPAIWAASLARGPEPTAERVALGRDLFLDPRLSKDGTVACATCHDATRAFTDGRPVSEGIGGQLGRRNAPTTMNASLQVAQFRDGRATTVEHQAGLPILNPIEMGAQTEEEVIARIASLPEYAERFRAAWGRDVTFEDLRASIGAFERTLVFLDAPFDRWQAGDAGAISAAAKRGYGLFHGKARCATCHPMNAANPLGTDFRYHNTGVDTRGVDWAGLARSAVILLHSDPSEGMLDKEAVSNDLGKLGRFLVTKDEVDLGAFKTPQLRNVGVTAPYMHDGSLRTLWDVVDHFDKGGVDNPYLDGAIEALALSEREIDDLVAFLFTLTDVRLAEANAAALAEQRELAAQGRPVRDEERAQRRVVGFERRVLGP